MSTRIKAYAFILASELTYVVFRVLVLFAVGSAVWLSITLQVHHKRQRAHKCPIKRSQYLRLLLYIYNLSIIEAHTYHVHVIVVDYYKELHMTLIDVV